MSGVHHHEILGINFERDSPDIKAENDRYTMSTFIYFFFFSFKIGIALRNIIILWPQALLNFPVKEKEIKNEAHYRRGDVGVTPIPPPRFPCMEINDERWAVSPFAHKEKRDPQRPF